MLEDSINRTPESVEEDPILCITKAMRKDMYLSARWIKMLALFGMIINVLVILIVLTISFWILTSGYSVGGGAVFICLISVIGVYLSYYLYSYGNQLTKYLKKNTQSSLELFFEYQERFWRFLGRAIIVSVLICLVLFKMLELPLASNIEFIPY